MKIAVVQVRGAINMTRKVKDTLKFLKLIRKNSCVIVELTDSVKGMLLKVKDYVTWGEIDKETAKELLAKRGRIVGNKSLTENYLKENMEATALIYKGQVLTLEPPIFVDLKIVSTEPGIRGDTSKSGNKPAKTETGFIVSVPLFVNEGDVVRIDTRTKEYVGRV